MVVILRYFAEFVLYRAPTLGKSSLRPCIVVRQRIEFDLEVLVYNAPNGLPPKYVANDRADCQLTIDRRRLRSSKSNVATCEVLVQVWVIDHSLSLDRVCGTT